MVGDWRKIERGLFESADARWRIVNPWKLSTELRHRWLVAERRSDSRGRNMHDGDHATLHDACVYADGLASTATVGREERAGPEP
jgi:hypothetical protein